MKTHIRLFLSILALLIPSVSVHAVTFTNTPTAVSNTYTGTISLLVSNIPTGDSVVVQKFLDINTNGVVDAADLLVQQFTLTDGLAGQVIGGVTNYNVPGDLNMVTGAVTATLSFNNGDFMQNVVGRYLYKISSPVGHFTPLTNTFTVTNFPFAQSFSGSVVSNSTSYTLSNSVVIIFPPPRSGHNGPGQPVGGTVANISGHYSIALPAGSYTLMAFCSNYMANTKTAPLVALPSSSNVSTNLTMTNATSTISGSVVDIATPSIGLPGVFMPLQSTNNLLTSVFTDTNGNFTAHVTPGQWSFGSDDSGLIVHGYVGWQNNTNVVAPAAGVAIGFTKANALFYGTVSNSTLGIPLADIDLNNYDSVSNLYSMDGYSDANGRYFVGAVATGTNDSWQLSTSSESTSSLTNYIFSVPLFDFNGTNLSTGTVVQQDFSAIIGTNTISGTVKDTGNNAITNVQVYAAASIGNFTYQSETNTDSSGKYVINVGNGTWDLNVYCGGGNNSLPNNYQCPNTVVVSIANNNVVTNFVIQPCNGVTINTTSPLPVGEVNIPYNQFLSASSCNGSFTWTNTSGSGALPPGISFYNNGQFSGTPTANGVYNFNIKVTDGNNYTTNQNYSLTIYSAVQVTTSSLPNGTNGQPYSQQLQASGGQIFGGASPYSWSMSPGSLSLPANLTLATNGMLSGTAATSGTFSFSVRATDMVGSYQDQGLSLTLQATNSGPAPAVGIASTANGQLLVYYPTSGSNFTLQTATNISGPWVTATNGVQAISLFFTNNNPQQFYRLH